MTFSIEPLALHAHHVHEMSVAFHREWSHLVPGKSVEWVEESFRTRVALDRLPMAFVAVDGAGDWLGTVSIKEHDLEDRQDLSPWLASLYVKDEFRNRGIGKALVEKACEVVRARGIPVAYLYTDGKERFYRNLGWTLVERRILHSSEIAILKRELA